MRRYLSLTALLLCSACVMPTGPGQKPVMNAASAPVAPTVSVTTRTNLRAGWRLEVMQIMPRQEFQACSIVHDAAGGYALGIMQAANGEQMLRVLVGRKMEATPSAPGQQGQQNPAGAAASVSIDGNQRSMAMTKMTRIGMVGEAAGDEWRTTPLPRADFIDQFRKGSSMLVTIEGQSPIAVSLDGSNDAAGALQACATSRGAATQPVVSAAPRSAVTTAPQKSGPGPVKPASPDGEVWDKPGSSTQGMGTQSPVSRTPVSQSPASQGQTGIAKPVAGKVDATDEKWD